MMNNVNIFSKQPPPVSYAMFVDGQGLLTNHEVREGKETQESYGFRKEYLLKQASDFRLSKKECADLTKDLMFKLFLGNEEFKNEVAIPFHRAFWGHLTEIKDVELKTAPIIGSTVDARKTDADVVWQSPDTGSVLLTEM